MQIWRHSLLLHFSRLLLLPNLLLAFSVFCAASIMALGTAVAATKDIPCDVRLEFSADPAIGQVASYTLSVQVKNSSPQPITAVSLLWLDDAGAIIGNSDADCRLESKSLEVSHTGQCKRVVQTVSGKLIQSFGQTVWTELVNSELSNFKRIKSCRLVGYRYG